MRSLHTTLPVRLGIIMMLFGMMNLSSPQEAHAQEPYIGEIRPVGFNFCPRGWVPAHGQLLAISQNTALFSLYGTMYGGDGRTTFALPDLRGRAAISEGTGPGLSTYRMGQRGGAETVTLNTMQMPSHTHSATATAEEGFQMLTRQGTTTGVGTFQGGSPQAVPPPTINVQVHNTGGSQAHENRTPYLAVNYCIALVGIFPSRN